MFSSMMSPVANLFRLLLLLTAMGAFRYGGRAAKSVAILYMIAAMLTFIGRRWMGFGYLDFEIIVAAIDFALLIVLGAMALKVRQWWLIVSVAFQLITCLGHLAKLIDPLTSPMAYFMMVVSSSYPSLIMLVVGVWQYHRTARARSWSGSSRKAAPRRRN